MTTLLASMLGFLGSMVPELLKLFQDKRDREHELKVMALQLEQQRRGESERLEAVSQQSIATEMAALYQTYRSGVAWVDALNGTVRPVLAYAFFMLYAGVKLLQYQAFSAITASPFELVTLLWNAEDQAIFAAIISFYYGQRAMRKGR